jgi:hypothetical protein
MAGAMGLNPTGGEGVITDGSIVPTPPASCGGSVPRLWPAGSRGGRYLQGRRAWTDSCPMPMPSCRNLPTRALVFKRWQACLCQTAIDTALELYPAFSKLEPPCGAGGRLDIHLAWSSRYSRCGQPDQPGGQDHSLPYCVAQRCYAAPSITKPSATRRPGSPTSGPYGQDRPP